MKIIKQRLITRYYLPILGSLCLSSFLFSEASHAITRAQCEARVNDTSAKLQECITQQGLSQHLQMLQTFSDLYGGRASGSEGFDQSAQYVKGKLESAGYKVTVQEFEFQYWKELTPPIFEQISPVPQVYVEGPDYVTAEFAGTADITAQIQPVGQIIDGTAPVSPTAGGCNASDFVGFVPGRIALIQRGGCDNRDKALNAVAAGAVGLITFNTDDLNVGNTLQQLFDIPVFAYIKYSIGIDLYHKSLVGPVIVHMRTDTEDDIRTTKNIIADSKFGKPNTVVMVGSHLDSVGNAGINDNGTGSANVLEMAIMLKNVNSLNRMRFAWWGAEESGLVGSEYYVSHLSKDELNKVKLYLNFDMIGSPNYYVEIYHVDNTDPLIPKAVKTKTNAVTASFESYLTSRGIPFEPELNETGESITRGGRSDHSPFLDRYIPIGGLFTGAEERKTPAQAAIYGGIANQSFDPCYHGICDDINNINFYIYEKMSETAASMQLLYAFDKKLSSTDGKVNSDSTKIPPGRRVGHLHE